MRALKKILNKFLLGISLLLVGLLVNDHVQAASTTAQNTEFEVIPLKPSSQVEINKDYFDLKIKPGKTETIRMQVKNYAHHKITVYSNLGNSFTQLGGDINFKKSSPDIDPQVSPSFTSIANLPKEYQKIELGPLEGKIVSATIKMPEEKQSGYIHGDWEFIEYAQNKDHVKSQGTGVSNNYSYSVGVVLRGSKYKVYPELKYQKVEPILNNGQAGMAINIRNTRPMMLTNATIKASITKEGLFSSRHVKTLSDKRIAENSVLRIPMSWDFEQLKPGRYRVNVSIKGNNYWNKLPMIWRFKKQFTIKNQQVKEINAKALKKPTNKWAYIASASGILTLVSTVACVRVFKMD